jgi:glycosyltransferase involved in cell wall biosynthesis
MNILFVHEVDWLKKVVFEMHNLAEALSLLGHRVYAIDYPDTWKRDGADLPKGLKTKEFDRVSRVFPEASVTLRRPGFIRIPGLSRFSARITHNSEIRRTIRDKKIDIIMLYSVPTNGLQAIRQARKAGIPVVFRSIDILHRLVRYPYLRFPTKSMEKKVYSRVDEILAITPHHAKYVIGLGAEAAKVKLLLLPIDTELFRPSADTTEVRRKWGFSAQDAIVVFIGTLFNFSGLDGFIREFPRVLEKLPETKLLIVGDGPQRPLLEKIIAELRLKEKVTITGFQPYNTMPQYINLGAVCINPFLDTEATRDIFPGKIIQYLACGKATVATPLLGIKALVGGEDGGIVYTDSPADMAREVTALLQDAERRRKLGRAGLDYVRQAHDQRIIARRLEAELLALTKKTAADSQYPK